MSTVSDIKNKKVDYQVIDSSNNINIVEEEDHGKLSIIIPGDDNNSIYVGDTHIASGYGFENIETKRSVEELLANENIKKLLSSDLAINDEIDDTPTDEIKIEDSSIYYDNDLIKFESGKLGGETWIRLYNIKLGYRINNESTQWLYDGNSTDISILDDVKLLSVTFEYTCLASSISLYYKLDGITNLKSIMNDLGSSLKLNGTKEGNSININIDLPKDLLKVNQTIPINLYITDNEGRETNIHIGNINFKYPIFGFADSEDLPTLTSNHFSNPTLYTENEDNIVSIAGNTDYNHYILVPYILTNPSFILKESNIGCSFNNINNFNLYNIEPLKWNNILYNLYKSPQQYNGNIDWIIK